MTISRIMYCCTFCADNNPEMCGYFARDNLRLMPDGNWLCDGCFDNRDFDPSDDRCWSDFPEPPEYGPVSDDPVSTTGEQK
jgi:hypothetical protein